MARARTGVDFGAVVSNLGGELLSISISDAGTFREESFSAGRGIRAGLHERASLHRGVSPRFHCCAEPKLVSPLVFYVTDRKTLPGGSSAELVERIRRSAVATVDFVQIREKDLPAGELLRTVREAVCVTREVSLTRIIVNDRLDVALTAGASGVHLGRESLPAEEAMRWCRAGNAPADFMVGVSCHSVEEAREAEKVGASYAFFGPVFDTPSKRLFGPPQGIELLRDVCCAVKMPVIAIGGVNNSTAAECIKAGAAGIAAIRMIQEATDVKALQATIHLVHHMPFVLRDSERVANPLRSGRRPWSGRRFL